MTTLQALEVLRAHGMSAYVSDTGTIFALVTWSMSPDGGQTWQSGETWEAVPTSHVYAWLGY